MKRTISYHYNRLQALFYKLQSRLNRSLSSGRFKQLTKQQQYQLIQRLEKLKAQLSRMEKRLRYGSLALATAAISLSPNDSMAQFASAGSEFRVNTFTTGVQQTPKVAMDNDGDFVVTWASRGQDTPTEYGIYAQRYNAQGVAQGAEFKVNTYTPDRQYQPAIAMDNDGDFVIVWTSSGQDGNFGGVFAQRFNAAGVAQGSEMQINTNTTGNQYSAAVAMDSDGDFAVTWSSPNTLDPSYGIYARKFDASGAAVTGEIHVNTYTAGVQRFSSIAMDDDGDFVVTWQSDQDGSSYGVYGQRFNASAVAQGSEFRVNTFTTNAQKSSAVAMDSDGDFVVAWQSTQDGNSDGVYAQRYNKLGVAQGGEFLVNTYTTGAQAIPAVAADNSGNFIIGWTSSGQDGDISGVYAQRYDAAGIAQGSEFKVNTYTTGAQSFPSIAADNDQDFVIAWQSDGQDGSSTGVYAQRFETNLTPTDLTLSNTSVNENVAANTSIGTLSTTDPDNGNTFTYTLETGTGSIDNASFAIVGDQLQIKSSPDFETKSSYSIRIRTTDQSGLSFEKVFTINVSNVNEAPTNISLSPTTIAENIAANTEVGTLTTTDVDASNTFTYTLATGTGDTDNASFAIVGGKLQIKVSPNFETKNSYSIRVRSTDQGGLSFEKAFTINVTNVNEAPTNITLSSSTIAENVAANTEVGTLTTTDVDASNTFTYTLVTGTGDTDNASFAIIGDKLQIKVSPDFETQDSYSIRVRSTDQGGLSFENVFTITITDVTETSISEANEFSTSIQLYPNPAKGLVQTNLEGSAQVRILDLSGHMVSQRLVSNKIINIEGIPTGVYMLEFTQNGKTGLKKLVIE